jgi:ABC-2 type transport system ATP-binding protein
MVQRLGLAQTLLHDPDLYILDEPMSGLDPIGRALVKEIIQELKGRGKTVFFSTHITSDVEVVCDRVGIIVGGRLRFTDNVESIMKSGIEGYHVQVSAPKTDLGLFAGYTVMEKSSGVLELYLPRQEFQAAMEMINRAGCTVDLVEPKRKGLETFFLEIVAKDTACN